jgi:hypothetical protein
MTTLSSLSSLHVNLVTSHVYFIYYESYKACKEQSEELHGTMTHKHEDYITGV